LWPTLALHAVAYCVFVAVTRKVFDAESRDGPTTGWSVGWVLAGAAVAASWLPLALPWRSLRVLWRHLLTAVLVGLGAGGAAWIAGRTATGVWTKLAPITLSGVRAMLRFAVDDVKVDEARLAIGTGRFVVQVAPVCSGLQGIGLIVVFLGGYIAVERKNLRLPRVLVLLPIAVVTVWVANVLRISLLILVGTYLSSDLAIGGFHAKAGWVLFCAIALGFVTLARRSPWFSTIAQQNDDVSVNAAAAYLMPLLTLLATALVTGLFTLDFDWLYPLRVATALAVILAYRAQYRSLAWGLHLQSLAIGAGVFVLWRLLAQGAGATATQGLEHALADLGPIQAALWTFARIAGMCVVVPIVEELAFRGYLLRRLVAADFAEVDARKFAWFPWLASSLAFGALHQDWLAATLAGLCYALAQQRRGRVTDAIVAHGVTNLLLSADALLLGHLHWWA
jgi:exosortase E/protease (VPEID-CTERM system)